MFVSKSKKPSRLGGYVRVSRRLGREGESFQSPEQQRETISTWAKLRGVEIVQWFEDIDKSGGSLSRPGLDALMDQVRTGQLGGVVVAKLDRLSRAGVGDALGLVEEISDAGAQLAAVDLGIDPTTPFGEFGMTIMLALGRMERRRLMEGWETSKAKALERGVHIGPTPFGYRRQTDDDGKEIRGVPLVPDEQQAPIVRETYRIAAENGLAAASTYLARHAPDRASEASHIRRMLARRVYLGEVNYGENGRKESHEPLVDSVTWERAQKPLERRKPAEPFPLSGIARCARCGEVLIGARAGRDRATGKGLRSYRCRATLASWRGERCTEGTNVSADRLEEYVSGRVRDALEPLTLRHMYHAADDQEVEDARSALDAAERELSTFASDTHARERLGDRVWQDALDARADAVEAAQAVFREVAQRAGHPGDLGPVTMSGATLFDLTEPGDRGWLFDMTLERLVVRRGRGPLDKRVDLEVRTLDGPRTFDFPSRPPDVLLRFVNAMEDAAPRER